MGSDSECGVLDLEILSQSSELAERSLVDTTPVVDDTEWKSVSDDSNSNDTPVETQRQITTSDSE